MRRDALAVVIACVILGVIIGFAINYCLRRAGVTTPSHSKNLKLPPLEAKPIPANRGSSLRRRAGGDQSETCDRCGSVEPNAEARDSKRPLSNDIESYISTDMSDVNIGRMVFATRTGAKFHYHVNCHGLRKSATLSLKDIREIEGLTPCTLCTGEPWGRV